MSDPKLTLWVTPDAIDISAIVDEATLDQIVQVLEGMGAKRMKSLYVDRDCNISAVYVPEPGTYLVLPLPTPQEDSE